MSRSSNYEVRASDIECARQKSVDELGNQVLYDLCENHPYHKSDEEIVAKVWLIGRAYAASIERRRNADGLVDDFYLEVARKMKVSDIDTWIESISPTAAPGGPETIRAHKQLTDLFKSISGLGKRSLASKYLHFHRPNAVYIYDSMASEAINYVVPRLREIPDIAAEISDPDYKKFVRHCVWLREHIAHPPHSVELAPRQIDNLLLRIANDEARVRIDVRPTQKCDDDEPDDGVFVKTRED